MEGTERVADRIAVIDHGRIVVEGTAAAPPPETGGRPPGGVFIGLTERSTREADAQRRRA